MADEKSRKLDNTPTWAVAIVCTVFFLLGFVIVFIFEFIEKLLRKFHRKPLVQTLDKIKEEFMLLGCISLLLTVSQYEVEKICIKSSTMDMWNPCPVKKSYASALGTESSTRRRVLDFTDGTVEIHGRMLAGAYDGICKEGYNSVVSAKVLHTLHTYIFVLACSHVVFTLACLLCANLKINFWRKWEREAQLANPDHIRDISQQLTIDRNQSFIRHHTADPLSRNRYLVWVVCFFRQFGRGVTRADYLSLRQGFIATHNLQSNYDFHAYLKRSLREDFPKLVGITPALCAIVIAILLFNVNGSRLYFWVSFVPATLIVLVGTKLQHVIATLALDSAGIAHHGRYRGGTVKLRNNLFWFKNPSLILFLIHYTLFQTSFETATFVGIYWSTGLSSCFLKGKGYLISRASIALLSVTLCATSTLPAYAIVVQMGSHYNAAAIFPGEVHDRLKKWGKEAKKRMKHGSDSEVNSTHHHESAARFDDESNLDGGTVHQRGGVHDDEYCDPYGEGPDEDVLGVSGRFARDSYHMDDLPSRPDCDRYTRSVSAPIRNTPVHEIGSLLPGLGGPRSHLQQVSEVDVQVQRHH